MTTAAILLFAFSLFSAGAFWLLPRAYAQDGFAVLSFAGLALVSVPAALALLASVIIVQQAMKIFDHSKYRSQVAAGLVVLMVAFFLVARPELSAFAQAMFFIGVAYTSLRHIHVIIDWQYGRQAAPDLRSYLHYHFMLPLLLAGPIHRLPHFNRQCERRRWSPEEFFSGAERVVFGFFSASVLASAAAVHLMPASMRWLNPPNFWQDWYMSAVDWIVLYLQFSGISSIALGTCMMIGLQLEENFNAPWRSRDFVDFWSRWHMSLSQWCRDYVFTPIAAHFRSPLLGVVCSMLVLGLWHEISFRYIFWALHMSLGIVLSHLYRKAGDPLALARWPGWLKAVATPLIILAWLALNRPLYNLLPGVF